MASNCCRDCQEAFETMDDAPTISEMNVVAQFESVREAFERLWSDGERPKIDEFLDRRLVLAEIELSTSRDQVTIPDWLARCVVREVTTEPEYLNHTLAR